jgi:L-iditol 2-dehydrogenase
MGKNYPDTMKALVAYSQKDYRYVPDYPSPECGDDDIIIKTEGCGICAGDVKCRHGGAKFWGDDTRPMWVHPPFIPGHEFLGFVVEMGKNAEHYHPGVKIGDRITADQIVPCGKCRFCKDGHYWMCEPHGMHGYWKEFNGGMAEYDRYTKNAIVHQVPKEIPTDEALMIEPFACSKHCVDRADIQLDDFVVLSGAGTLGLGMVTYAHLRNPKHLVVLDMIDKRLDKALEFGATEVFNPGKVDVVKKIREMTDGYGCDTYIEATGHPSSVIQGLTMLRRLGRFVEFSVFAQPTTVDWTIISDDKELDVRGVHLSPYCFPYTIDAIATHKIKAQGVVTAHYPLSQWEEAFRKAEGKEGDFKVALIP